MIATRPTRPLRSLPRVGVAESGIPCEALAAGRIESAAILRGISEPPSRWIATKWPGALVVDADSFDSVTFAGWSKEMGHICANDLTLAVLYPRPLDCRVRRNHPAGKGLGPAKPFEFRARRALDNPSSG